MPDGRSQTIYGPPTVRSIDECKAESPRLNLAHKAVPEYATFLNELYDHLQWRCSPWGFLVFELLHIISSFLVRCPKNCVNCITTTYEAFRTGMSTTKHNMLSMLHRRSIRKSAENLNMTLCSTWFLIKVSRRTWASIHDARNYSARVFTPTSNFEVQSCSDSLSSLRTRRPYKASLYATWSR